MSYLLDKENINGLRVSGDHELTSEEQKTYLDYEAERRLLVFGPERMAEVENNLPTPEAVATLSWKIEELCMVLNQRVGMG